MSVLLLLSFNVVAVCPLAAHQSERILKEARLQVREPSSAPHPFPLAKETWKESAPQYRHESNTSSDSSVSSVSLNNPATLPSTFQAIKDVNYTPVVFSAPESVLDYENIKEATDYVNVNPEKPKPKIWTSVNASFVDPVEYTQVAV
ncbi:regulator of hemoglobinization and erythroid cell expansion protein isoform X2 [Marmota marmota marmota]|uniref:regulator of hemoglobinization and erythroid cell expansion protein isoform X2 n=1 Tax=Marmota marmota marmota TaxID=9994 RepID=UPI002093C41B|nr:regulator of hemoglobinization and erythroid cell expansion protein isoform X2 [Marmota marmota marmota]